MGQVLAEKRRLRGGPDGAPTRERLIQAASDLLSERDTLNISLGEVAQRAGLNHGLVSYYFGGKQGLLLALLEHAARQALAQLERLVEADLPPLRKIELHIRGVLGVYLRHPYINRLIAMLQSSGPDTAKSLAEIFILPLCSAQRKILDQAMQQNAIRPVDPILFYYTVIGSCDFLFQSQGSLPYIAGVDRVDEQMRDDYANHLVKIVIDGLRA